MSTAVPRLLASRRNRRPWTKVAAAAACPSALLRVGSSPWRLSDCWRSRAGAGGTPSVVPTRTVFSEQGSADYFPGVCSEITIEPELRRMVPLEQVSGLLRCPKCRATGLRISGGCLACAACKKELPIGTGRIDLLGSAPERLSRGQRVFFSPLGARGYALMRERRAAWLLNRKTFPEEVKWLTQALELEGNEVLLDVPCGQGNFTQALARSVPRGVVIGLDLSTAMLAIAQERLERESVLNAVLVRGDALDLPLADGVVQAVSDCGGLHLYPDVPRAVSEMRRVLVRGGRIAGLTFRRPRSGVGRAAERLAARFAGARAFDFDALGDEFRKAGFEDYRWEGSALIAWFSARAR